MNYELLRLIVLVVMIVVICQALLGAWYFTRSRDYRRIARTERIRLRIGDARCRLVNAAARGELKATTATFQQLYIVQTSLMRGTDHYPALSEALWAKVLRFEKRQTSELAKEAKHWSPEVRDIATQTTEAVRQIWIAYMPWGTSLRIAKHLMIRLGIVNYESLEWFSDRMLTFMVRATEQVARFATVATFRQMALPTVGLDVRLAHDMRQTERHLRKALAKAA